MAALGHTSTPFCFVIRQLLGFFPGQVHLSEVSLDDIYPVFPRSSWLSLVTSQFPVCCLTSCSRVVHSQDVSQPPEPSFFNYIFQFSFWCLHFWPCPSMWSPTVSSGTYGELLQIFSFVWQWPWFCTIQQGWDTWLIKPDFHGEADILAFPDVYQSPEYTCCLSNSYHAFLVTVSCSRQVAAQVTKVVDHFNICPFSQLNIVCPMSSMSGHRYA